MVLKNFDEMVEKVRGLSTKRKVALVAAEDKHALEAVLHAEKEGIVEPVLVGDEVKIKELLKELNATKEYEIYNEPDANMAAYKAVELVRDNKADFLMKGKIETAGILKAVVDKEKGLGQGRLMSHFAIIEVPTYHKLLVATDGGMVMYPSLDQKKEIINNAVDTLLRLGYERPKVGVLAAIEKVNPKMPETIDADKLKEMNLNGEIKNCIVEGPISYDLAMYKEAAKLKGYESEVAGDVDVLVVPDITTGNVLGKSLIYSAKGKMAGIIIGAKVPIILTSRGSSAEEKFLSLALAAATS
ncbi:MAG: bifunctional enoyl-CoA hydratase/phosphate acetyltransferase [Tissierellia bacterium]|nr:bifunctional enoyl-CoA hydratase/phosphate acetyltransferase [Tissierellia bacterium]